MGGRRITDKVDPTEADEISSLKRAESDLRERELALARTSELLQLVLDTIPVRVFWKDLDLRYLGYNQQDVTQRFTGKGLAGFLQKPFRLESLTEMVKSILDPKDESPGPGH